MWNFAAWSISAEWIAYLAFPVIAIALQKRSALVSGFAFAVLLGLLNLLALTNGGRLAIHHDWGAVRCLLEFAIGILVYEADRRCDLDRVLKSDAAFALVLGSILVAMHCWVRDILIVPGFALLVLCAARNTGFAAKLFATRPLRHLGDVSYSIYMVNILLFQIVHYVWLAAGWGAFGAAFSPAQAWAAWLAAMALVVATSHFSYRWFEEPARAWLRRRAPIGGGIVRGITGTGAEFAVASQARSQRRQHAG